MATHKSKSKRTAIRCPRKQQSRRATTTHQADDHGAEERSPDEWKADVIDNLIPLASVPISLLDSLSNSCRSYYRLPESTHEKARKATERFKRELESILRASRVERTTAPHLRLVVSN